jgi:hypothetical protein
MVLPSDGGGSGYTSVDPGQIRKFAQLLDSMTEAVQDGPRQAVNGFQTSEEMFGAYNASSSRSETKHTEMVRDARTFWTTMHERFGNIAAGTHELATRYTDLADLNEASGGDITTALAAGAKKA